MPHPSDMLTEISVALYWIEGLRSGKPLEAWEAWEVGGGCLMAWEAWEAWQAGRLGRPGRIEDWKIGLGF